MDTPPHVRICRNVFALMAACFATFIVFASILSYVLEKADPFTERHQFILAFTATLGERSQESEIYELPVDKRHLSANDHMYYTKTDSHDYYVFPTSIGRGGDFMGYLYAPAADLSEGVKLEVYAKAPRGDGRLVEVWVSRSEDHPSGWYSVTTGFMN